MIQYKYLYFPWITVVKLRNQNLYEIRRLQNNYVLLKRPTNNVQERVLNTTTIPCLEKVLAKIKIPITLVLMKKYDYKQK